MQKRIIDLTAASVCLSAAGIAWFYPEQVRRQELIFWIGCILTIGLLLLAVKEVNQIEEFAGHLRMGLHTESEKVSELILLSEEDTELTAWDLFGKTAAVIGRDVKENQVDIDLSQGPYASMVDVEHAVLNFSSGNWYVEDLGSSNGISVKKAEDGRVYRLSPDTPCRLERGDCLNVGLNRLLLR